MLASAELLSVGGHQIKFVSWTAQRVTRLDKEELGCWGDQGVLLLEHHLSSVMDLEGGEQEVRVETTVKWYTGLHKNPQLSSLFTLLLVLMKWRLRFATEWDNVSLLAGSNSRCLLALASCQNIGLTYFSFYAITFPRSSGEFILKKKAGPPCMPFRRHLRRLLPEVCHRVKSSRFSALTVADSANCFIPQQVHFWVSWLLAFRFASWSLLRWLGFATTDG